MGTDDTKRPFYQRPLFWACVVSVALLSLFLRLQATSSSLINLPVQWIWVSLLPVLLALIVGGYISKLKFPGVEYESGPRIPGNVPYAPPGLAGPPKAKSGAAIRETAAWTAERPKEYQRTDNLFLVHVCKASTRPDQRYDVTIFLMRHIRGPLRIRRRVSRTLRRQSSISATRGAIRYLQLATKGASSA
jgi:hypothetical protein